MEMTLGTWRVSVERTAPEAVELAAMYDAAADRWHRSVGVLGYSRAYSTLRWGRMGGLAVLRRYGSDWFALLALKRWGRITTADLEAARPLRVV